MPSLHDVLADKANYPDTQKITLADGVEATLGDLRGGFLRQQDYTAKTTAVANERNALVREREEFNTAKAAAEQELQQIAERLVSQRDQRGQQTTQDELDALMERDPLAKRLRDEIVGLKKYVADMATAQQTHEKAIRDQHMAMIADQHRRALATLKARDNELDTDALVTFAQQNGIPRLDLAYRLMTEDKRTAALESKVKTEAEKTGYERAKRELAAPTIPNRRVIPPSNLPQDAPKTFDQAADRAAQDPEILNIMTGAG